MVEIRRIRDVEGDVVAGLWSEMTAAVADGGPLSERGRRNIALMLQASAWHRRAFCLVAVEDERIVGFVNGTLDTGDGLLPGAAGEVDALHVVPAVRGRGLSRRLAETAVAWLRERGASTVRMLVCAEDAEAIAFWRSLGFEADMTVLSLYGE
jgi:ribosomal protein S18 acetylase RimI-like enzyme